MRRPPFLLRLIRESAGDDPITIAPAEFADLRRLLDDYLRLAKKEHRHLKQLAAARSRAGRKPTPTPTPSTLRSRASRARKKGSEQQ